ncbi:Transmembrane amino acid transporter protein [Phytophthora infestans]|uniref:Transmembrane amino acid transporter protein n=1 Tax=Phytophthora infestans TaxID=4787 RepID=A0A8S9UN29_PHYIN|nr:Transmembrane amino acid transporter protein [Phytophthora infestans]
MSSCLLMPCVFLVLGGQLLDGLFPNAFSQSIWTILMALTVLPVCLVPTLKEGSGAAFAGCVGTIIADITGVGIVMHGMRGHPSVPYPELKFSQVAGVFGNLFLAYGAGIVIPDLQRQHGDPRRMPRVVGITVAFASALFLVLASTAYSVVGCQISGNLLFTIYPDSDTGLTSLGFASDWGMVVLAYIFMQFYISIAFSVVLNPAFYLAEFVVLGMHKKSIVDTENGFAFEENVTPAAIDAKSADLGVSNSSGQPSNRRSKTSYVSVADSERVHDNEEEEAAEYIGTGVTIKYVSLRIVIITILVVLATVVKDHFTEFADFVGASCITMSCILLPTTFYLIKAWGRIAIYEKAAAGVVLVACSFLGCYVTYTAGKALFAPTENDAQFPYCHADFESTIYYNYTAAHQV